MPVPVDIVLPCYNPGDKWPAELESFFIASSGLYQLSFIVVNDGTTTSVVNDQVNSLEARGIPVRLLSYEVNKGKGYALRTGIREANSDFVLYTDIDFPFTNESMHAVLQHLIPGETDVVAGFRSEGYYQKKMSGFRKTLSKTFRFFIRRILKMPVSDTQCGLKGFNKKGREKFLATRINRYLFDFEFIYSVCRDKNLRIQTVEVQLKDNVLFSKMKMRIMMQETLNLFYILLSK
jgi:glycosyltransferase involved in cell wall biosynthesis